MINKALKRALETGEYFCRECGARMKWIDEDDHDELYCPKCGFTCDLDSYGYTDEEYTHLYDRPAWVDDELPHLYGTPTDHDK